MTSPRSGPTAVLAARKGLPANFLANLGVRDLPGGSVAIPYHSHDGSLLFTRQRLPDGSARRFLQPEGVPLAPYGRERLAGARRAGYLVLSEGESDAWVLWHLGLPALAVPGSGAAGCLSEDDVALVDLVLVAADNDTAGEQFWEGVRRRLRSMAWPGEVRRLRVPAGHKDVGDWFVQSQEAVKDEVLNQAGRAVRNGPAPSSPVLVRLADVTAEAVRWLWPGWLPEGALAILDGDPGLGKSTLTLDLAARVTRGWAMPPFDREQDLGRPPASVLLLGAEDSLSHTVRPRLDAAGADVSKVHAFEGVRTGEDERLPILPGDLDLIADRVQSLQVRLVIVDPFMAYLGSEIDAHKDQDVRRCLRPLSKLAEHLGVTVLLLRHLNKLSGGPALYRGGSSIGISGAARASLIVGRDPSVDRHVLAMNKLNLAAKPASLAYRLEAAGVACRIVWDGETELTPDEILGHGPSRKPGRPDTESREARLALADLLASGPVPAREVRRWADEALISWRTVNAAKAEMGVVSKKTPEGWTWELPGRQGCNNSVPGGVPGSSCIVGQEADESDATPFQIKPYDEDPFPDR